MVNCNGQQQISLKSDDTRAISILDILTSMNFSLRRESPSETPLLVQTTFPAVPRNRSTCLKNTIVLETVPGQCFYRKVFILCNKNSEFPFIKAMSHKGLSFRQEKFFSQVWSVMTI